MHADLRQLSQQVTQERELYKMKVAAAFAPIRDLFNKYSEVGLDVPASVPGCCGCKAFGSPVCVLSCGLVRTLSRVR
eukprot:1158089-Pelagomonas_calceolata.AAC.2